VRGRVCEDAPAVHVRASHQQGVRAECTAG
jgi:hypothetical protein